MKHVFIAPRSRTIYIQYFEFAKDDNLGLVMMEDSIRRFAKGLTLSHINSLKISDSLFYNYFEKVIKTPLEEKGWAENICFILYGRIYESYGESIVRYLRKRYSNCKIVVYFGDLVSRHKVDIPKAKILLDKVLTFDIQDAKDYGLDWCLEPLSANILKYKSFKNSSIRWDVTFVGAAKMRYKKILQLYERLCEAGLKCDFHIPDVKVRDRAYVGEIGYEPLDFKELLKHVNDSYCVAEVLQDGGVSPTTRYSEAMLFGKNMLTDCVFFADERNRTQNIFYFKDVDDLKEMDLVQLKKVNEYDIGQYVDKLSIKQMIKTIDESLEIKSK